MPEPETQKPPHLNGLRPLRTYQSDVEEALAGRDVSLSKIALAENEKKRKETRETPPETRPAAKIWSIAGGERPAAPQTPGFGWRAVALAGGVILVALTLGFILWRAAGKAGAPSSGATALLPEKNGAVELQGEESRTSFVKAMREKIAGAEVPLNELRILAIRANGRGISTEEFFSFLESRAGAPLIRALDPIFTAGVHGIRGNQFFLLYRVNAFDLAFDGMLAWEKTLFDDIGPLFGILEKELASAAASTTADALKNRFPFKDTIIRNKDARAVFDGEGRIVLLYSFLDRETLFIAANEETMKAVLPRADRGRLR